MPSQLTRLVPSSIAARLYCVGGLTLCTILVLGLGALLYVGRTERVVTQIRDHDVTLASAAADIEILLERHRRIIESAPVEVDLVAVDKDRRLSEAIADHMTELAKTADDPALDAVKSQLEPFVLSGRKVLYLAANFAQAEALDEIKTYTGIANTIQEAVRLSRANSIAAAERSVADLIARGKKLTRWITFAAVIALFLVLPLTVFIIRGIASRIKAITEGMRRVALNETSAPVPSLGAHDEIGEMARALEVFKRNALTLLSNSKEIEKLNSWFHIALNNMARGLSMFDADRRLLVCNERYLELYKLPRVLGKPGTPFDVIAGHWCLMSCADAVAERGGVVSWIEHLQGGIEAGRPFSETHDLDDGRTVLVNTQPLADGGWVDLHEDITDKRASEAQIEKLARFDALTGLANRHHFQEKLDEALLGLDTLDRFAVLWFDLDKFKAINDTLGHPAGDEVLKIVADRLRACVRGSDFVARLGGDEFAIIISGPGVVERDAALLAERLLRKLSAPYEISDKIVSVGVSIGIALAPSHGKNAEDLIKHADIALYQAKARGRGMFIVFNSGLAAEITARDRAESDLRRALAANELLLHYQPILDVKTGKVKSCEALMRWQHPTRGMVSPAEFIPLAEEIGLIEAMGEWAIRQACHDAAGWPGGIKVAVNLAATQLTSSEVAMAVADALAETELPASRLELEVTETIMLKDNAATINALQALRGMGVTIALDDFGTGYASLSYLRSFPFDKIKIDQCFVKDIATRDDCFAIVKTIVSLARSLGMSSVAEGIETPEVLERVIAAGCDESQGYYFSRPVPAADLLAALHRAEACQARAA